MPLSWPASVVSSAEERHLCVYRELTWARPTVVERKNELATHVADVSIPACSCINDSVAPTESEQIPDTVQYT